DLRKELEVLEKKWGLLRYENPCISCATNIFWSESLSTRSIMVKLHDSGHTPVRNLIPENISISRKILIYKNNLACIKLFDQSGYMQIFIDESDLKNIQKEKYIYFSLNKNTTSQIANLLTGRFTPSNPYSGKMDFLHIFDKHMQGLTQKELALFFYGEELTQSEWGSDSWLRARIRYKLKVAEQFIFHDFIKYI
ncbi:DUF2285 domain-containing protein, partial [Serratia marcescens]|uniref:DUF2285 domain-containing protein n=1 Tax=Serratia marcescens TaxID=615 RepID=UPI0011E688CA